MCISWGVVLNWSHLRFLVFQSVSLCELGATLWFLVCMKAASVTFDKW